MTPLAPQFMMAVTAVYDGKHQETYDRYHLCLVNGESGDSFVGNWVEGYGHSRLLFPKSTTRPLTPEEIRQWEGATIRTLDRRLVGTVSFQDRDCTAVAHTSLLLTENTPTVYRHRVAA